MVTKYKTLIPTHQEFKYINIYKLFKVHNKTKQGNIKYLEINISDLFFSFSFRNRHVRDFYEEVTAMMVKKFPFRDETLKTLGFVNPALKESVSVESGKSLFQLIKNS